MKWPTTLILLAIIGSTTALGYQGQLAAEAVTSIYTGIVGGVLVGHYVKTINGAVGSGTNGQPPTTREDPGP